MKIKSPLIVEKLEDGGCLVVDEDAQQSHALGPQAAAVWACLESETFDRNAIAAETSLDRDTVDRALAELTETGLLVPDSDATRREILSRAAAIVGAGAGLALIDSVATPTPAAAQSPDDSGDGSGDGMTG